MAPRIYQAYKSPVKVRMPLCSADVNQGFPVILDGVLTDADDNLKRVLAEPEIYSAFATYTGFPELIAQARAETQSDRRNLISLPNMGQNTLNYKGTIYALEHIQVCQSQQRNILARTIGIQNAACVFSYRRTSSSTGLDGIFLIVPLIEKESLEDISLQTGKAQMFFTDMSVPAAQRPAKPRIQTLQSIFENTLLKKYFYYSSCVLTRSSPTTTYPTSFMGLYFPGGWVLPKATIELIGDYTYENGSRYAPFYIPSVMRQSYPVAKIQYNPNTSPAIYTANAESWSTNGQTYVQVISVNSDLFVKRIRIVEKGLIGITNLNGAQSRLKTTFEYQCLPLDKIRDVDGRNVLLDPATGLRSLADTITGTPEIAKDITLSLKVNTSGIEKYAIIAGSIAAFLLILIGFSFLVRYMMARNGTPEGVAALAAAGQVVANTSPK